MATVRLAAKWIRLSEKTTPRSEVQKDEVAELGETIKLFNQNRVAEILSDKAAAFKKLEAAKAEYKACNDRLLLAAHFDVYGEAMVKIAEGICDPEPQTMQSLNVAQLPFSSKSRAVTNV